MGCFSSCSARWMGENRARIAQAGFYGPRAALGWVCWLACVVGHCGAFYGGPAFSPSKAPQPSHMPSLAPGSHVARARGSAGAAGGLFYTSWGRDVLLGQLAAVAIGLGGLQGLWRGGLRKDPRLVKTREAIAALLVDGADRAERVQMIFSRPYEAGWQVQG